MSTAVPTVTSDIETDDARSVNDHRISGLPVLVIFPHNQCNCRCAMCDIWRIREAQEITPADLDREMSSLRQLGVQWAVFSGGEPQMNSKWFSLARTLKESGIRVTMLTAGLLLERDARLIAENIDDVIVSLDGPPAVHNAIRRVPNAFEQMSSGVQAVREFRREMQVRARCTVQKLNHACLCATVQTAKQAKLNSISFLAADLTSSAFNRSTEWSSERQSKVALNSAEVSALDTEIERLVDQHPHDFASGFMVETPEKLRRIVQHFRAHLGEVDHVAPRCNAPWVSAVIEANGDVRPCFFHAPLGNIRKQSLTHILNGHVALQFRQGLDVATNPTCRQCVCSLYVPQPQRVGNEIVKLREKLLSGQEMGPRGI